MEVSQGAAPDAATAAEDLRSQPSIITEKSRRRCTTQQRERTCVYTPSDKRCLWRKWGSPAIAVQNMSFCEMGLEVERQLVCEYSPAGKMVPEQ